jgi:DNA-binding GntR family transcriptional regulator
MRGPTAQNLLATRPPELRKNKAGDAHQAIREKILKGAYDTDQVLNPSELEKEYGVGNTAMQTILLRLAIEGLIKIQPLRERKWPNNAAYNEYRVADLNVRHRIFSTRHGGGVSDISREENTASSETEVLEVQRADDEIAKLLSIQPRENIIWLRVIQKSDPNTIIAITDTYLPFWFAEVLPELKRLGCDIYQLMRQLGENPTWCTETVDVVQASSVERTKFQLSPDDTSSLFKILRIAYDSNGTPLSVDFLTDRGDKYRLHYSFPLFADGIPHNIRNK